MKNSSSAFESEIAKYDKLSAKFDVSAPVIKLATEILRELVALELIPKIKEDENVH